MIYANSYYFLFSHDNGILATIYYLKGPLYTFGCTKFLIANVFRTRRSPIYTFCHMRNGKADQKGNIASCNFHVLILLLVTIQVSQGFKTK